MAGKGAADNSIDLSEFFRRIHEFKMEQAREAELKKRDPAAWARLQAEKDAANERRERERKAQNQADVVKELHWDATLREYEIVEIMHLSGFLTDKQMGERLDGLMLSYPLQVLRLSGVHDERDRLDSCLRRGVMSFEEYDRRRKSLLARHHSGLAAGVGNRDGRVWHLSWDGWEPDDNGSISIQAAASWDVYCGRPLVNWPCHRCGATLRIDSIATHRVFPPTLFCSDRCRYGGSSEFGFTSRAKMDEEAGRERDRLESQNREWSQFLAVQHPKQLQSDRYLIERILADFGRAQGGDGYVSRENERWDLSGDFTTYWNTQWSTSRSRGTATIIFVGRSARVYPLNYALYVAADTGANQLAEIVKRELGHETIIMPPAPERPRDTGPYGYSRAIHTY